MPTFLHARPYRRPFNLQRSTKYTWLIRWFVKSWLGPGIATAGFVFLLAYTLAEWCVQS